MYIVLAPIQASLSLDRGALSYKLYVFGILVLPFLRMNVSVLKLELDKTIHWLMLCVTCVRRSPGGQGEGTVSLVFSHRVGNLGRFHFTLSTKVPPAVL